MENEENDDSTRMIRNDYATKMLILFLLKIKILMILSRNVKAMILNISRKSTQLYKLLQPLEKKTLAVMLLNQILGEQS